MPDANLNATPSTLDTAETATIDVAPRQHARVRTYDRATADLLLVGCGAVPDHVIEQIAREAEAREEQAELARREHKLGCLRELAAHEAEIVPEPKPRTPTIIIAGCGKLKADTSRSPAPARDLYIGGLAAPRIAYVAKRAEALGVPWLILSAGHGLLDPCDMVRAYDVTFGAMRADERRACAERLARELPFAHQVDFTRVELHAGAIYGEVLALALELAGITATIERPLAGKGLGEQRAFYLAQEADDAG